MRRNKLGMSAVLLTSALVLSACAGDNSGDDDGVTTLRFQSLAFKPELVETMKDIVEQWNEANADIQVEFVQGDWGNVHDQLTASFEGGTAPDIFHYESDRVRDFADRGNVLDLDPYLSDEHKQSIGENVWETVSYPDLEGIWGVPFLQEVWAVYVDADALAEAGVEPATENDPWTWEEYADIASQLTEVPGDSDVPEVYGGAIPLGNPATRILPLAPAFGGKFFETEGSSVEGVFGADEESLIVLIDEMLNEQHSLSPDLLAQSPSNAVAGFVQGDYRTLVAPIHLRQDLSEGAGDLNWEMLPPLVAASSTQAAVTQSFSVWSDTETPEEAVEFLEFLTSPENQVSIALGDMLLPAATEAVEEIRKDSDSSWAMAASAADSLEIQPYQQINGAQEWITRVATPALEGYFNGSMTIEELRQSILEEGNAILDRYDR